MPDVALVQRKQQQEELSELQVEHARKRKKLVTEQDGEIQQIKQDFVGKKESTLEQGQASVNHIKKTQNKKTANGFKKKSPKRIMKSKTTIKIKLIKSKKVAKGLLKEFAPTLKRK